MSNILFVGDIASPDRNTSELLHASLQKYDHIFGRNYLVGNLEGLISESSTDTPTPILFNHPSVLAPLKYANTRALSLSNNHTLDLPEAYDDTRALFSGENIALCGAGKTFDEAFRGTEFYLNDQKFIVYGLSWEMMFHNKDNPTKGLYVSELNAEALVNEIISVRQKDKTSKIIVIPHWNFDLETLPFPMDRELSRKLIDHGVDVIVGGHSHCIQPVERYKHGLIAYCLGNFWIPWHTFINGKIKFPEFSRKMLVLEWNPVDNQCICHLFRYTNDNGSHGLELLSSLPIEEAQGNIFPDISGFSDEQYIDYFKANRRKNFLLPVYKSYSDKVRNRLINQYLLARIKLARTLAKYNLRGWNN